MVLLNHDGFSRSSAPCSILYYYGLLIGFAVKRIARDYATSGAYTYHAGCCAVISRCQANSIVGYIGRSHVGHVVHHPDGYPRAGLFDAVVVDF